MANEFKIKKGLIVTGADGGTVVDIQGSQGQLFSVTDDLSGSIFAVSDISGVPIFDVNSSGVSYFDGNVGIGTTAPGALLSLNSGSSGGDWTKGLLISWSGVVPGTGGLGGGIGIWHNDGGSTSSYIDSWYNNAGASINFRMRTLGTPVNAMTILGSGNVGIGTTSPGTYKLNVAGTGYFSGAVNIAATTVSTSSTTGALVVAGGVGVGGNGYFGGNIVAGANKVLLNATTGAISSNGNTIARYDNTIGFLIGNVYEDDIDTKIIGFGGSTSIFLEEETVTHTSINSNFTGKVGIGTTNPGAKLQVEGTVFANGEGNGFMVENGTAATARTGFMKYGGYEGMIVSGNTTKIRLAHRTNSNYVYGGTPIIREDLVIDAQGNVGIGTATPGAKLQVKVGSVFPLHAGNVCGNVGIGVTTADLISGSGLQPRLTVKGNISYGYNNYSSVMNTWSNALNFSGYPAGLYQVNICKQSDASSYIIARVKWSGTAGTVINTVTSLHYGITFSGTQLQSIINTTTATSISVQCLVTFESCLP